MNLTSILIALVATALSSPAIYASEQDQIEQQLQSLATALASDLANEARIPKIAIVDFIDLNGYQSALGMFIAEELTTQFFISSPSPIAIVERRQLARVLEEQKLSSASLFDPESVASVGRILGIEALVTGTISDLGEAYKINARLIDVESAMIVTAASAKIPAEGIASHLARQNPGSKVASLGPITRNIQRSDAYFENSILRATVDLLGVSEDKKRITIALSLRNLKDEVAYVGLENFKEYNCKYKASFVDNLGNALYADAYHGQITGLNCVTQQRKSLQESYSLIDKGAKTVVTLVFQSGVEIRGNLGSVSLSIALMHDGEPLVFPLGISGIRIR